MIDPVDNLDEVPPSPGELEIRPAAIEVPRFGPYGTQTTREGLTASSGDPPPRSGFALKNVSKYGLVALDAAAAGLSVAATRLASPLPIKVTVTLSGSLWTSAAIIREWDNSARSKVVSATNFLSGAAGVFVAAAPHLAGENRKGIRYASAGVWAVNSAANLVRAIGKSDATLANRVLIGASGLANAAGAALSAASVNAAAEKKSADALKLATASGAMLLAGWAADAAAAWTDGKRSKLLDSEQHGLNHLHAHYERDNAAGDVAADRPASDAHSLHSGSFLPHVSANAPGEQGPARGLHHLHAHYERDGIDGQAVVTGAHAPDHHSVHFHGVAAATAKEPASPTEDTGKAKYDQRQRNEHDGRVP